MSHRTERVAEHIQSELARLLREEVRDPRIGFVTITGVDLSPDLKNARVWISALGQEPDAALGALQRAAPFLRRALARDGGLRFTPQLRFEFDGAIAAGQRVESILSELHDDEADPGGEAEEEG